MKQLFYILTCLAISGCFTNYTVTSFYVKNNTDKTVNFKAAVMKYSSMGEFEMTVPFTVLPNDSVLARRAKFRNDILPHQWFTQFIIFPVDGVLLNDPNIPENWIRSADKKGKPVYSFNIAK